MGRKKGRTRRGDPSSSHEGGDGIDAGALEAKIWTALKIDGGWRTYFEISNMTGVKYASVTPRGKSLWDAHYVVRKIMPNVNDEGKPTNLLHFKACTPDKWEENPQ